MPCGIGGILSTKPFTEEEAWMAWRLLASLTRRGRDAWGYYDGSMVYKEPGDFLRSPKAYTLVEDLVNAETNVFLCHTRLATQGDPSKNQNNHPFDYGHFVFAHNGQFFYADPFYNPTDIETDSFWLLYWIEEEYGFWEDPVAAIEAGIDHVRGIMACWLYFKPTGAVYLWRDSRPLVATLYAPRPDLFVFASDKRAVADAFGLSKENRKSMTGVKELIPHTIYEVRETEIRPVGHFVEKPIPRLWEWRFWMKFGHLAKYVD